MGYHIFDHDTSLSCQLSRRSIHRSLTCDQGIARHACVAVSKRLHKRLTSQYRLGGELGTKRGCNATSATHTPMIRQWMETEILTARREQLRRRVVVVVGPIPPFWPPQIGVLRVPLIWNGTTKPQDVTGLRCSDFCETFGQLSML